MYFSNRTYQCICTDTLVTILISSSAGFPMSYHVGSTTESKQRNLYPFVNVYMHFYICYILQQNEKALPFGVQKCQYFWTSRHFLFMFHSSFSLSYSRVRDTNHSMKKRLLVFAQAQIQRSSYATKSSWNNNNNSSHLQCIGSRLINEALTLISKPSKRSV